ncbi:MAG: hypothetical protein ACOVLE_00720 [Pirellula staleyi]
MGFRILLLCFIATIASWVKPVFQLDQLLPVALHHWVAEAHEINEISVRDLILFLGGLFLIYQSVREIHHLTESHDDGESLVDSGFELSTLTAFIWVPLVFVAWADGKADTLEKNAIFDVLRNKGISQETASMMIAHEWFRKSPNEDLWKTWQEFATTTLASLAPAIRNELIDEIVGLCHVVAHASGGFLGVGTISETEANIIDRVIGALQSSSSHLESVS